MLHAAAQGAATQQERVHDQRRCLHAKENRAGQAIAAEAVGDVYRQALPGQALDFRRRTSNAGGIHLVGALRELRHAVHLRRLHGSDGDFQFERSEKIFQAGCRACGARTLRALDVHFAPAAVFLRDARPVESPYVRQKFRDLFGARRQQQRQHLRSAGLRLLHLLGIVVHQDEAVETDFQLFGEGGEVACLGIPVNALRHEVVGRERHFRMDAESGGDILLIVLAAQGEQHTVAAALRHEVLKGAARRVQHHAFGTVLAADAGP